MIRYGKMPLPDENGWLDDMAEFAVDLLRGLNRREWYGDPLDGGTAEKYL